MDLSSTSGTGDQLRHSLCGLGGSTYPKLADTLFRTPSDCLVELTLALASYSLSRKIIPHVLHNDIAVSWLNTLAVDSNH